MVSELDRIANPTETLTGEHEAPETEPDCKTRFLAFLCVICPFCILARKFPKSKFAKAMRSAEANCPACKAYVRVKGRKQ